MGQNFWGGLIEGFQAKRESEYRANYERELQNRQMSDRVFQHLLSSRDPQMQEMALQGMSEPIGKKKGMAGYLGGVESNPFMAQIVARMNEMVPDHQMGQAAPTQPTPPASPGSAAMSTNAPIQSGAAPIQLPGQPLPPEPPPVSNTSSGVGEAFTDLSQLAGPPELQGPGAPPMPPPQAPTLSPLTRRGTGVPNAEEIAEMQARVPLETRIKVATEQLQRAGATPDEIQQAVMGMLGAPQNNRTLSAVAQWGVRLTPGGPVVPVLLDQNKGYVTAGRQALPPGAEMVRMGGGGGTGMTATDKVPDTPEGRATLAAMGWTEAATAPRSPTGWLEYKQAMSGEILVGPATPFIPPQTAFVQGLDQSGNPAFIAAPRTAAPGTAIAGGLNPQATEEIAKLKAFREYILSRARAALQANPAAVDVLTGARRTTPNGQELDAMLKQVAPEYNIPQDAFPSFGALDSVISAPNARQSQPRPTAPKGTDPKPTSTDLITLLIQDMERRRQAGGGAPPPPPAAPPAAGRTPVRGAGPGPRR